MATVAKGGTLPDTGVTKNEVYALVDNATVTSIVNADIAAGAAIADSKLATISSAGKVDMAALTIANQVSGDIMYHNASSAWTRLVAGSDGQILKLASGLPAWGTGAGTGSIVQVVNYMDGASATGSTVLPYDNTIPTSAEGDQYMSASITPSSISNKLLHQIVLYGSSSDGGVVGAALFNDGSANALTVGAFKSALNDELQCLKLSYYASAGTVSATTFRVRAGVGGGTATFTFNGCSGVGKFGGVMNSSMTISEIVA